MAESRERDSQSLRSVNRIRSSTADDVTENSSLIQEEDDDSIARTLLSHCKPSCARRAPPISKGLLLVFFIYLIEAFAFYTSVKGVQELLFTDNKLKDPTFGNFLYTLMLHSLGRLFYLVGGVLADSFLGRFKVIEIGLWLIWTGIGLVCFALSVTDIIASPLCSIILATICIILIAIGSGFVEVNIISFGVDQLSPGCPSEHISSYFYLLYFVRNAGTLLGVGVFIALATFYRTKVEDTIKNADVHFKSLLPMMLGSCLITICLFLHIVKHHWYFKNCRCDSPIKSVAKVSWYCLTVKRHAPIYRRTFRYGEPRQPRIELAKKEFDGIFEAEEVENVKTFYQVLFLILSLGGYFVSYGAAYSLLDEQFEEQRTNHYLLSYFNTLVNTVTILIVLPIVNHVILPFFNFSLKIRLGIGLLLNLLAIAAATYLQGTIENYSAGDTDTKQLLWLFLPSIILALGEMITFVSSLEFIFAQAPEQMKGLLTGLFYFVFGLCDAISSTFFYRYPTDPTSKNGINFRLWFYVTFTVIALFGLLIYAAVACLYRNRRRPSNDEDDLQRILYAENVYSH